MRRLSGALLALLVLAGCALAPSFTGNGTGISMQGGTATQDLYVTSGWAWSAGRWQGYCNQAITNHDGQVVGWYVDDQVNDYAGPPVSVTPAPAVTANVPWSNQANCVRWDHKAYPGMMVVAGIGQWDTSWSFAQWGAIDAQEWYPICGNRWMMGPPPRRGAFIMQWNFRWPWCGPTPKSQITKLDEQLLSLRPRPTLLLYY